jgi:hypothetical protein
MRQYGVDGVIIDGVTVVEDVPFHDFFEVAAVGM